MCPKFCTNPVLNTGNKCQISTNLSSFLKLCLLGCQKLFALAPTNRRFAEKNRLSGNILPLILPVRLKRKECNDYNLYSLHSFLFCLTGNISGRIYVMDDNNICCIMNADFVLTNNSTNTNQKSSSVIKLLIDLTAGMEILVHFSSLFIILNSIRNTS